MGKEVRLYIALVFIVGAYFLGVFTQLGVPTVRNAVEAPLVPAVGFVAADVSISRNTVTIADGCRALVFDVTPDQAFSIANALDGGLAERPLTHDMLADALEAYGIRVLQARVDRFEDGIYKATVTLFANGKLVEMDTRPSDAIGIALRTGTPVLVSSSMLAAQGRDICA